MQTQLIENASNANFTFEKLAASDPGDAPEGSHIQVKFNWDTFGFELEDKTWEDIYTPDLLESLTITMKDEQGAEYVTTLAIDKHGNRKLPSGFAIWGHGDDLPAGEGANSAGVWNLAGISHEKDITSMTVTLKTLDGEEVTVDGNVKE